jgi:small subunit ribosomal protein S21|tara:strand:+ start:39 stop:269 length:231 start_codon:yes stop_codon:yes gene_type:complete
MAKKANVTVKRKDNETIERMLRRFSKKVKKEGIMEQLREKAYYKKPSEVKRKKNIRRKRVAQDLQRVKEEQLSMND